MDDEDSKVLNEPPTDGENKAASAPSSQDEMEAWRAYEKANTFLASNPSKFAGALAMFEVVVKQWPQTDVATLAQDRMKTLQAVIPGFWKSYLGKVIRWILFLPIGIVLLCAIDLLCTIGTVWLCNGDLRLFIIIGILLGTAFTVIPLVVVTYYGTIYLAVAIICPSPKTGAIIFGTVYFLWMIPVFIDVFGFRGGAGVIVPTVLWKVIFLVTAGATLFFIHQGVKA